jgi:hypothetical protein
VVQIGPPTGAPSLDPHWEALTSETQQAFHIIASLDFINSFYLAGGSGKVLSG